MTNTLTLEPQHECGVCFMAKTMGYRSVPMVCAFAQLRVALCNLARTVLHEISRSRGAA